MRASTWANLGLCSPRFLYTDTHRCGQHGSLTDYGYGDGNNCPHIHTVELALAVPGQLLGGSTPTHILRLPGILDLPRRGNFIEGAEECSGGIDRARFMVLGAAQSNGDGLTEAQKASLGRT